MRIGDELIQEGIITEEQLNIALKKQESQPSSKIGEILLDLGFIDIDQLTRAIELQLKNAGMQK